MSPAFLVLTSVLVLATVVGIIAKAFKQPLILAYIFAGIVISFSGFFNNFDTSVLDVLSSLGIALLLFLVGIDLNLRDLAFVGKTALYTGVAQIVFTALVGFILVAGLGFDSVSSLYMAVALTFSSTVIITKLLAEKHDLQSLFGKIAIGLLLVQDFVAILALMLLSGFGVGQSPSPEAIVWILVKGALLVALAYLASRFVLRYLFRWTSVSVELLFVSALAWAFLFAALGALAGFSIAIGGFLAGLAIASSPYRIQISARVKPLRDFFTIIFFIVLGASMSVGAGEILISDILILSLFILIGKPLIVLAVMLTLGFRNRTAFLVSVTGAQVSEFSLILLASGLSLGHVAPAAVSLVAAVGIVTITLSSYLILYGDKIYRGVAPYLSRAFPEKARDPYVVNREKLTGHAVLVGAEQMGADILEFLRTKFKDKKQIVVVDFNPQIIKSLMAGGYNAVFGDIADPEVLEELELSRAHVIIITDPDASDNSHLIKFAKGKNYQGPIIATAYWIHDAIKLYEAGADYVVVPELVGGNHVGQILAEHWSNLGKIKKSKSKNLDELLSHRIF